MSITEAVLIGVIFFMALVWVEVDKKINRK